MAAISVAIWWLNLWCQDCGDWGNNLCFHSHYCGFQLWEVAFILDYIKITASASRYLAICHPLSPLSRSSTGQAKKMICFIWLVSFMSASPWAFFTKVNYLDYEGRILEESAWCSIPFNEETHGSLYMMLGSTLLYFFAPMFVVTLLYTRWGLMERFFQYV